MGESILALPSSSMISIHDMEGEGFDSDSSWSDGELRSWRLPDIFKCCSTLFGDIDTAVGHLVSTGFVGMEQ